MKKLLILLLLAASSIVFAAETAELKNFTHCKKVGMALPDPPSEHNSILLDREVYKELNDSCNNLLLLDKEGKFVPFVLKKLPKHTQRTSYTPLSGKITDFQINYDKNQAVIEYEVKLKQGQKIGKLELQTSDNRQFKKSIMLQFADGNDICDLKFFNHTGTVNYSRNSFEIRPQSCGKVKIVIAPFAEKRSSTSALTRTGNKESFTEQRIFTEELSLKRITFYAVTTQIVSSGEMLDIVRDIPALPIQGKADQSIWEFALQKTPVRELHIFSSTLNYHREYKLEFYNIKDGKKEIVRQFSGNITPGFKLNMDEIRADGARLTVENRADQVLSEVIFTWYQPQYALLLAPGKHPMENYKLYYGGSGTMPDFDLQHYINKFSSQQYSRWQLAAGSANEHTVPVPAPPWTSYLKKLLPYIIGAAALLLAIFSIKMLKNAKTNDNGEW